jgi:hypothetical protein
MDFNSGKLITRNIIHEIPVTDVVIKPVKTMSYKQGFKSLKFKNRHGAIFHDADWIAGVDYDDNDNENEEDDDEEYHHAVEDNKNEEEQEQICPDKVDEVDDITSDAREDANPTIHEEEDQPEQLEAVND